MRMQHVPVRRNRDRSEQRPSIAVIALQEQRT
jgi:hypothetical protein